MSKQGKWIEVQIRSDHMDEVAEQGFAAHWKYKEQGLESSVETVDEDSELNNWLSTIKEILDDPQPDAMDFLDTIKLNLFASEIFVFTPKRRNKDNACAVYGSRLRFSDTHLPRFALHRRKGEPQARAA